MKYEDFLARLPNSHRAAISEHFSVIDVDNSDGRRIKFAGGMVGKQELALLNNLYQKCIYLKIADNDQHHTLPCSRVTKKNVDDAEYNTAIELMECIVEDLCCEKGELIHAEFRHWGNGFDRIPQRDTPVHETHGLTFAININDHADFAGGQIYFPERGVFVSPRGGNGLVFWSDIAWGVAPVKLGSRRVIVGYAKPGDNYVPEGNIKG